MSLARPFKAGKVNELSASRRRRLKLELEAIVASDENWHCLIPALKRRAKLMPPLRVEDLIRASNSKSDGECRDRDTVNSFQTPKHYEQAEP